MSNEFYTILTNAGLNAIANATTSQTTVQFSKLGVGDGNGAYYTPTRDMTALRGQKWVDSIENISVDENNPNWIVVEAIIPAAVGGFYVREVGIYNQANVLLAIGKLPETYKPEVSSGSTKDMYIKVIFEVTNANAVTLRSDPSIMLATKEYVTTNLNVANSYTDNKVALVNTSINNVQNNITAHANNKNNPHEVNKTQIGLNNVENYAIASQSEAEGGTVSNKYMTPQRTKQAIQKITGPLSNLQTTDKTSVVNAINEVKQYASDGKNLIAAAVTGKGQSASSSDTFATLANKITAISTGKLAGVEWTEEVSGTTSAFEAITYGEGLFVAVGASGIIITSPDGITWTQRTSVQVDYTDVAYGAGTFVAISASGIIITSTNGYTWTQRASDIINLRAITYESGLFVAVGGNGKVVTSPDGITWTQRTTPITNYFNDVAYGNGRFVAVGGNGIISSSTNGITWTSNAGIDSQAINSIAYGNGIFVAVGILGKIKTSTTGTSWTNRENSFSTTSMSCVTYGQGLFVIVCTNGKIIISTDGINWTEITHNILSVLSGIAYGGGKFIICGNGGRIFRSENTYDV